MGSIISLAILIILCIIFCVFCGYITKAINESKGYTGGFWLGLLLQPIGILIVAYKKEQPNAKANAFRAVPVQKVLKKFRYPFAPPQFEPIAMLKGEIDAEAKAAGLNLTFMLIHGLFMLCWYSVILGAYIWYIMGYAVYWMFKSQSLKKIVDDAKPDAAEKVAFAKEKTRAAFSGLKDKASAFAAEHKKSSDERIPVTDEYDTEENYNTSSDETVYQSDEEYSDETVDSNADNGTSYEYKSDENNSPVPKQSSIIYKKESQIREIAADDTNIQPAPMSSSPVYNTETYSYNENKKSPIIYILIGVISVLLVALGVLFGMLVMKNKSENNNNSRTDVMYGDSTETSLDTEEMITSTPTTVSVESTTPTTNSDVTTALGESYVQENVSKDEVNQIYINIINETDFLIPHRGFIIDLNNDGVNELIVPNTDTMSYIIYYYTNGTLASQRFGSFMSLDNFQLYKVSGDNGTSYIYYRDNYVYKSKQGYFSFIDMTQLNIFIDYPENNGSFKADWTIDYNETESYAKGNEPVDTFYAQPADCHKKLISAFSHYGFSISENTSYTEITGLYKDELINKLSNDNTVKKPTISAYIEGKSNYPIGDGIEFILHTSGDYSYYHYEGYETGGGEYDNKCASGDTSESEIRITAGSSIIYVKAVITPYNANGATGETITVDYTVAQSQSSVKVYSCDALGQINAPSGGPINGYATSYIVDRGTVAYTRTDLMDNWHVTAVRYCVVNGITWYELYDTDDGDYYGWLDGDHIDFY